jgi:VWFA-related protein
MLRSGRQLILLLPLCALTLSGQQPSPDPQQPQPRPPVFRAGAHYVRVDAYPTAKDGKIVEGLTKDDFEIYEDGKIQTIESSEYITFDTWTPDAERKDPRNQEHAYELAGDPTYRVFVIVLDRRAYNMEGRHYMRAPLHEFIDRNLGPRDLFGLLSTEQTWTELTLGQKTIAANALVDSLRWVYPADRDERLIPYYECGLEWLIPRKLTEETYDLLDGLVRVLALVRQEKKSIVFVANNLSRDGAVRGGVSTGGMPPVPRIGVPDGRIGIMPRGDRGAGRTADSFCSAERLRLTNIDFEMRFRELLRSARQGNVAFYPIAPAGLQGIPFKAGARGFDFDAHRRQTARTDTLITLAHETDGIPIVNTNDLAGGMRRIANDMRAYYVLGYYTTNTNWDGRVRSIKVRLKPKRDTIRARREYRAPTPAEIAGLSNPTVSRPAPPPTAEQNALAALDVNLRTAKIEADPGTLVGSPAVHRLRGRMAPEPVTTLQFERAERVRIEWPVLGTLERRDARLLDRTGKRMPVDTPLSENGGPTLTLELPLAPFARGDYLIELHVGAGAVTERRLLAVRIK